MQKIILPCPSGGDNNGGTFSYFRDLKFELIQLGRSVDLIDFRHPSALPQLVRAMEGGGAIVYSNFFTDLRLSATNHFDKTSLFDLYGARPFLLCADMPYKLFMLERLRHSGNAAVVLLDKTYEALIRLVNPAIERFSVMESYVSHQQLPPVPWADREIDVLIPMNFSVPEAGLADLVAQLGSAYGGLILAYYQAIRANRSEDPFAVFDRLFTAVRGHGVREECARDADFILSLCIILSTVDDIVRQERRRDMVRALLADLRPFSRVVALGTTNPFPDLGAGIEWIGYQSARAMHALMVNSRVIIHTHPVTPQGTHERVADALMSGAVLVSDENGRLKETLRAGVEYLAHVPGRSLAETVAGVDLAGVAEAGRAFAEAQFTMARHAAYLDGVFRRFAPTVRQ